MSDRHVEVNAIKEAASVKVPAYCQNCINFDWDYDEYRDMSFVFCKLNIFFPVRKGTCRKHRARKVTP